METPSKELLQRVKSGEQGAFEELYRLCYQHIYSMAFFLLKNHHDAEDVVQNTFLHIYTSIRSLRDEDKFVPWMDKIAYHEYIRQMQFSKEEVVLDEETEIRYLESMEEDISLPAPYTENRDLLRRLWKLLLDLPAEQRQVLVLFYYQQLSVKEIAEITGVSVGTVMSRLRYARAKIKKFVEQQEKKTGDKFYGVPMLPFGEVFEQLLDRNTKKKKKENALLAGFQKELQSLGFSGNSVSSVGNKHLLTAKIAAGVIAAAILLGGISAAFTGNAPDIGRGWGNLIRTGQNNPKSKNPSEPVSNENGGGNPISNSDDTAPRENITADNVFNQSVQYDTADNNNQNGQVLPTQSVVQNPLTAPTQALTNPTQQPAVNPTTVPTAPPAETQNHVAYQAYRDLLLKHTEEINDYDWQFSDKSLPVALADFYGDSTPELLFLTTKYNIAYLNVFTYNGTNVQRLLGDPAVDYNTESDYTYFLFQKRGEKRLYLYTASDRVNNETSSYVVYEEVVNGVLSEELLYRWSMNGGYKKKWDAPDESDLFSDISSILLCNDACSICSQEVIDAMGRYPSRAMSLDDMLHYLEQQ